MSIIYKTRNLYPNELRLLKTLKARKEKEPASKIKFHHFLIVGLIGASLAYITSIIPDSFWTLLLGTIAAFAFTFIVFMPYEIYKLKMQRKEFSQRLGSLIDKGTVDTCPIKAKRVAIAEEYEDESDLYIIELNENEVLYLWDTEYNLNKKLPSSEFEIYDDSFFKLLGRRVYPLSDKIPAVKIDKKAKWNYMKKHGVLGTLEIEKINFDELLEKYTNCA